MTSPNLFEMLKSHRRAKFICLHDLDFGSRSAHLAYLVHKSGRKTSIIIIIIIILTDNVNVILSQTIFGKGQDTGQYT